MSGPGVLLKDLPVSARCAENTAAALRHPHLSPGGGRIWLPPRSPEVQEVELCT